MKVSSSYLSGVYNFEVIPRFFEKFMHLCMCEYNMRLFSLGVFSYLHNGHIFNKQIRNPVLYSQSITVSRTGPVFRYATEENRARYRRAAVKSYYNRTLVTTWQWILCACPFESYRGADKSLARTTLRCILFDDENISFDASLVLYINSTNIPPIIIINRIYEYQNLLSL